MDALRGHSRRDKMAIANVLDRLHSFGLGGADLLSHSSKEEKDFPILPCSYNLANDGCVITDMHEAARKEFYINGIIPVCNRCGKQARIKPHADAINLYIKFLEEIPIPKRTKLHNNALEKLKMKRDNPRKKR